MFNAAELVGNLMQGGLTGASQRRIEHAFGNRGLGRPGGVFAQLLGNTPLEGDPGAGGLLGSVAEMATSMLGGAGQAVRSGNTLLISGPHQRRLAAIPRELTAQGQAIVHEAKVTEATTRAEQLTSQGQTALRTGHMSAAEGALSDLKALRAQLEQEYELRIVSRPHERSGVWRSPTLNAQTRNYYIIVEAVTADGTVLTLPVTNEEDGKTYNVSAWGLRVDERLFAQIAADKQDDGIIQNRRFGIKRRGYLEPEYLMPTTGAAITSW